MSTSRPGSCTTRPPPSKTRRISLSATVPCCSSTRTASPATQTGRSWRSCAPNIMRLSKPKRPNRGPRMKAVVCEAFGGPEVLALREIPDPPPPGGGEDTDLIPRGMSLEEASVFRGAYSTAYHALLQRGRLTAGNRVLIHGAAGGIGIPAIQLAKTLGAEVIATASTEEKRSVCLAE